MYPSSFLQWHRIVEEVRGEFTVAKAMNMTNMNTHNTAHGTAHDVSATQGARAEAMEAAMAAAAKAQNKVVLENAFIAVHVDLSVGIQTVVDKDTGVSYAVRHDLLKYVLLNKYLLASIRERVRGTCTGYTL